MSENRDFENWPLNTGLHTGSNVGKKQNFKSPWLFQRLINWTILFHSCFSVKSSTSFDDRLNRTRSKIKHSNLVPEVFLETFRLNIWFFSIRIFFVCSIWFNGRVNCMELMSFVRESPKTERSMWYTRVMVHRTCDKVPNKFQDHCNCYALKFFYTLPYFLDKSNFFKLKSVYAIQFYKPIFNSAFLY